MKTRLLALTLSTLLLPGLAQAGGQGAFGESTADLDEMLEQATGAGKIWYKGEHLSLHKPERLQGLTKTEREMILMVVGDYAAEHGTDIPAEEEILRDFSSADGYITYFSHNSNGREFAIVASYPGDNEFGAIVELKKLSRKREYTIVSAVATISDGDLEDCQVID